MIENKQMKAHRKIAKAFGYELIKRRKSPSSNSHLLNLISHYKVDLVLDVGANKGQFASMLRDEGYSGDILSFEPVSTTFKVLQDKANSDSRWHAHQCALGEEIGTIDINIMESSDLSSVLSPNEFGKEKYNKIKVLDTESVPIDTIDNFLKTNKLCAKRRILLKMDTQGFDLSVFAGARTSIKNIICIQSEISLTPIYSGMPNYLDSLSTYEKAGFVITGLYPISRKEDMSVIEMDCMMLNKEID